MMLHSDRRRSSSAFFSKSHFWLGSHHCFLEPSWFYCRELGPASALRNVNSNPLIPFIFHYLLSLYELISTFRLFCLQRIMMILEVFERMIFLNCGVNLNATASALEILISSKEISPESKLFAERILQRCRCEE